MPLRDSICRRLLSMRSTSNQSVGENLLVPSDQETYWRANWQETEITHVRWCSQICLWDLLFFRSSERALDLLLGLCLDVPSISRLFNLEICCSLRGKKNVFGTC